MRSPDIARCCWTGLRGKGMRGDGLRPSIRRSERCECVGKPIRGRRRGVISSISSTCRSERRQGAGTCSCERCESEGVTERARQAVYDIRDGSKADLLYLAVHCVLKSLPRQLVGNESSRASTRRSLSCPLASCSSHNWSPRHIAWQASNNEDSAYDCS